MAEHIVSLFGIVAGGLSTYVAIKDALENPHVEEDRIMAGAVSFLGVLICGSGIGHFINTFGL